MGDDARGSRGVVEESQSADRSLLAEAVTRVVLFDHDGLFASLELLVALEVAAVDEEQNVSVFALSDDVLAFSSSTAATCTSVRPSR